MKLSTMMKEPSAFLPVTMSLIALVTLLVAFVTAALSTKPMKGLPPTSGSCSWGAKYRSWRTSRSSGCRRLRDRRFTYWRYNVDSYSQHLRRFTSCTFSPRGRLQRAD
jgi:hypothetical protein